MIFTKAYDQTTSHVNQREAMPNICHINNNILMKQHEV